MLLKLRTLPAFLCLVFLLAFGSLAAAQDTESFLEGQREMLSGIENSVAGLETEIGHQSTDDAELVDIRVELERLGRSAPGFRKSTRALSNWASRARKASRPNRKR